MLDTKFGSQDKSHMKKWCLDDLLIGGGGGWWENNNGGDGVANIT
jgi:hypothetical protein